MKKNQLKVLLELNSIFLFFFLVLGPTYSCNSSKKLNNNKAYLYKEQSNFIPLQTSLIHTSSSKSSLVINLNKSDWQQDPLDNTSKLFVQLFPNRLKSEIQKDSIQTQLEIDFSEADNKQIVIDLDFPNCSNCIYKLVVKDQISLLERKSQILVDKTNTPSSDWLKVTKEGSGEVVINNRLKQGESIEIESYFSTNDLPENEMESYRVEYFQPTFKLAIPPFLENKFRRPEPVDSTFKTGNKFRASKEGLYKVYMNAKDKNGNEVCLNLLSVDASFPQIASSEDLIESLRYITQNEEYKKLREAKDAKKAVDDFWLERAGSYERGKVLIREFYGRVQRANSFFSTTKKGWKTDRGLIFVIYGEPDEVYKEGKTEQWVYIGTASQPVSNFTFQEQRTPHGIIEPFRLVRDRIYEDSWHRSVYEWRKGLIGKRSF